MRVVAVHTITDPGKFFPAAETGNAIGLPALGRRPTTAAKEEILC